MDTRLLDVLHDAADEHRLPVARTIDIDLDRVVEESVEQHRGRGRHVHRVAHVSREVALVMDDLHCPAAKDVGGTHDERVADFGRVLHRAPGGACGAVGGLAQTARLEQPLESLAILGEVDVVRTGPDDGDAMRLQGARKLERGLPAVLHDHPLGPFDADDLEHVLKRQRLEVETIGRVVVGRHGLRIAVDHDALVPRLAHRERGLHAAVVELDALPDAVRPTAEHDDLPLVGRLRFALLLVGRVHVRGGGAKLRRARIDSLVDRVQPEAGAMCPNHVLVGTEQRRDPRIGEALALETAQRFEIEPVQRIRPIEPVGAWMS